ncbi:MAG: hypothetical protein A2Y98_03530 [Candidatus Portnoybacteria bacterium RBG_19FT_COMBO_36_7]|uniref:Uncharacterized protein n=1 Tax=Candidatus Portnoybacteria bacterium RBG_19FT_COMBO_36_7 TaxID=1801992 RepID=A0A1G2F9J9_9BACT|nr:MAG: hypothetical protein A2Y98_03530 [Candidatus Portnoybacteria bacterium RBG_19FT_COMBO_36_7]
MSKSPPAKADWMSDEVLMIKVKYKHNLLKPLARFGNGRAGKCQIKVKIPACRQAGKIQNILTFELWI